MGGIGNSNDETPNIGKLPSPNTPLSRQPSALPAAWQRRSPLFFYRLLQYPNLEHLICQHLLQLRVLLLKLLEALEVGHFHPSILAPPPINGLFADVGLPAELFHGFLPVCLAQYLYYLFC